MITYLKHIMKICNTFFINVFYTCIFIIFMFLLIYNNFFKASHDNDLDGRYITNVIVIMIKTVC